MWFNFLGGSHMSDPNMFRVHHGHLTMYITLILDIHDDTHIHT